ncbi:hypothetical protein TWF696_009708 [Orbilia brochopaga]|uniref:1-alkyl-2-acetylglycerophosphocholine esterase n=1 Tax=Orbilia brochopaga TaxID=3140254 RepID=A0AAV9UBC1_9PEZI
MSSLLSRLNPIPGFPAYKGPYAVGTIDLELPVAPFVESKLSPSCPSHADIPTVQMRVFYPAKLKEDGGDKTNGHSKANWIPSPRKEYIAAYCRFAGAGEWLANLLSFIPHHLYYVKIPVLAGHRLLPERPGHEQSDVKFPVVVFSHGLGGTRNAYSYLTASLASYGAVVFCLEHRDGSAPASFVRESTLEIFGALQRQQDASSKPTTLDADGNPQTPGSRGSSDSENTDHADGRYEKGKSTNKVDSKPSTRRRIDYTNQAHEISEETAAVRCRQLEIRLWELGLAYAVIHSLNAGFPALDNEPHVFPSPKDASGASSLLGMFKGRLALDTPGSITWMGHSFGAATITQFLKSVWYWPELAKKDELKDPLYVPSEQLVRHFHPTGKIGRKSRGPATVLLDLWCLPLIADRTRALWRRPLPGPVLGVLSWQFYKWKDNLRGFRHVMSRTGGTFEPAWFADLSKTEAEPTGQPATDAVIPPALHRSASLDVTPQLPAGISHNDESKIEEEEPVEESMAELALHRTQSMASQRAGPGEVDRKFYYPKTSAHMSQSDFGILFPRSARYFTGVNDSEGVLEMNIRAVTAFMREQGLKVAAHVAESGDGKDIFGDDGVEGWEAVELELGDEGLPKKAKEKLPMKEQEVSPNKDEAPTPHL